MMVSWSGMKNLLGLIPLLPVLLLCSCGTTPQQRQQVASTMLMISAAGMQAYVTVAMSGCKGDALCEDKIVQQYGVYTNAVNAALVAYQTYEQYGTNYNAVLKLAAAVSAASVDVTKAIIAAQQIK